MSKQPNNFFNSKLFKSIVTDPTKSILINSSFDISKLLLPIKEVKIGESVYETFDFDVSKLTINFNGSSYILISGYDEEYNITYYDYLETVTPDMYCGNGVSNYVKEYSLYHTIEINPENNTPIKYETSFNRIGILTYKKDSFIKDSLQEFGWVTYCDTVGIFFNPTSFQDLINRTTAYRFRNNFKEKMTKDLLFDLYNIYNEIERKL